MLVSTDTSELAKTLGANTRAARIFIEEPGLPPRVVIMGASGRLRIGRGDDQDVRLEDTRVSRAHCLLELRQDILTVLDTGSSNGTFVDTRKVEGRLPLAPGSVVQVGNTRLVVVPPTHGDEGSVAPAVTTLPDEIVSIDPNSAQMFALARRLASSDLPVLIQGETGAGKEVVARALHRFSRRAAAPFIAINCAALPESLAESELFGHERGSFTGAHARKPGVFEAAHGGVLLLDEVGELSRPNQARLLRVLQERRVSPIGATREVTVDVRVLCATNRDLAAEIAHGRFREDLYFRLNGVTLTVPSLRDRPGDIVPLAKAMAMRHGALTLTDDFIATLTRYAWPGNVRELHNAIDCAAALSEDGVLRPEHLPSTVRQRAGVTDASAPLWTRLEELERASIVSALTQHHGNQSHAAKALGISRRTLIYRMERYGLKAPPRASHSPTTE